jgi:leucyl aminopeptidase
MKIHMKKGTITNFKSEAIVAPLFQKEKRLSGAMKLLDKKCKGLIGEIIKGGDIEGKHLQVFVTHTRGCIPAKRIVLVGAGKRKEFTLDRLRGAVAAAAREVRSLNLKEFSTSLEFYPLEQTIDLVARAVVEGAALGLYRFLPYKTVDRREIREIEEFVIVEKKDAVLKTVIPAVDEAGILTNAVYFARDMASQPGNEMTPTDMANEARKVARRKNVVLKVYGEGWMKKMGMNAFLGVAKGSDEPAKFIVLEYRGGKKNAPFIALVGKGLTFDSGGISLKPAEKMDEMKSDMAGGAAVMGALMAAADLELKVNVVGLVPATENLPGGRAYKPGDVLKTMSGQTIEIISTDAEGRMILADALTYAGRYKPAAIIDLATLTGACVIALGENVIGMMGTDDALKEKIRKAGDETGERVWELPLWEEYNELIKSDVADYKNSGGRPGGAITAAALLGKFVGKYPWAHLDIAGPAWLSKERPYIPRGASGVGVRLLVQFLKNWQQKEKQ